MVRGDTPRDDIISQDGRARLERNKEFRASWTKLFSNSCYDAITQYGYKRHAFHRARRQNFFSGFELHYALHRIRQGKLHFARQKWKP